MRKVSFLASLVAVAGLGASLYGGSIRFTATDVGEGRVQLGYEVTEGTAGPLYLTLQIGLSNGVTVNGREDVVCVAPEFPVYVDNQYHPDIYPYGDSLPTASTILVGLGFFTPYSVGSPGSGADLNGDMRVDMLDLDIFADNYLKVVPWPEGEGLPFFTCLPGDFNKDCCVNLYDYAILATGGGLEPPIAVENLLTLQLHGNGAQVTNVTISDRGVWDSGMINMVVGAVGTTVVIPEPASTVVMILGATLIARKRRR